MSSRPALFAIFLLALAHAVPAARAQDDPPAKAPDYGTPEEQMKVFIESFSKGSAPVVIEEMLRRNPFFDQAAGDKAATAVKQITENFRLYLDYELAGVERITSRFSLLTYVLHFERQPILFRVRFYNIAENTWVLNTWDFSVDPARITEAVRTARENNHTPAKSKPTSP